MIKLSKEKLNLLIKELIAKLENKFGNNFTGLVLFGSYAKYTENKNSDIDFLISFKKLPKSPIEKFTLIREIIMEIEDKYDVNLSPISIKEDNVKSSPLIIDIAEYAKVIVDKNKKINKLFSLIKKKYANGHYQKILVDDHYMLKIENG